MKKLTLLLLLTLFSLSSAFAQTEATCTETQNAADGSTIKTCIYKNIKIVSTCYAFNGQINCSQEVFIRVIIIMLKYRIPIYSIKM